MARIARKRHVRREQSGRKARSSIPVRSNLQRHGRQFAARDCEWSLTRPRLARAPRRPASLLAGGLLSFLPDQPHSAGELEPLHGDQRSGIYWNRGTHAYFAIVRHRRMTSDRSNVTNGIDPRRDAPRDFPLPSSSAILAREGRCSERRPEKKSSRA